MTCSPRTWLEVELLTGYIDGLDPDSIPPGPNRSEAYRHGFSTGRDDALAAESRATPKYTAAERREQWAAIERKGGLDD